MKQDEKENMNMSLSAGKVSRRLQKVLDLGEGELSRLFSCSALTAGKKLRAKLFLSFCGEDDSRAVDIASSIELLHAASLIHDDVLDGASCRRGRASLYRTRGIPESVLYGDYLFSEAFRLVSSLPDPYYFREMTKALSGVLRGEVLEQTKRADLSLTREGYLKVIGLKTGSLFSLAARLGAHARKSEDLNEENASLFGMYSGMAYQVMDDYMDYFAQKTGKDRFSDIREGVITLPLIILCESCSSRDMEQIASFFKCDTACEDQIMDILDLMRDHKVPSRVLGGARRLIAKARTFIDEDMRTRAASGFDVSGWILERINDAEKEYSHTGGRLRRDKCPEKAQEIL
ncbi:MAG: hypothetical protein GF409_07905 [Candidatus Omnitrophica bacterium]|nr:hypothetical protein [Candidatus Omnitrophota bacterium]